MLQKIDKSAKVRYNMLGFQMNHLEEYEDEEERAEELSKLSVYTKTKKFIEDIAREKFGLVYDNEVILSPEEEE